MQASVIRVDAQQRQREVGGKGESDKGYLSGLTIAAPAILVNINSNYSGGLMSFKGWPTDRQVNKLTEMVRVHRKIPHG